MEAQLLPITGKMPEMYGRMGNGSVGAPTFCPCKTVQAAVVADTICSESLSRFPMSVEISKSGGIELEPGCREDWAGRLYVDGWERKCTSKARIRYKVRLPWRGTLEERRCGAT